ncbi:MAG: GTPase [Marinicella sp.]
MPIKPVSYTPDEGINCFAGRSNSGKSTTINALTNHKRVW